MTGDTPGSMFSLLYFSPKACASQTSLSPSVEDAKAEAVSILLRHSGFTYTQAQGSSINRTVLPKM